MRIVSYNILDGGEGRADPLAEVIEAQHADVIALVESAELSVVDRIAKRLKMDFVQAVGKNKEKASTLLTRWRIKDSVNHGALRDDVGKSLLEVTLETPAGKSVTAGIVHLTAGAYEADEQVRERELAGVLEVFASNRKDRTPHLLMGDFNSNSPVQRIDPAKCKEKARKAWEANGGQIPRRVVERLKREGYADLFEAFDAELAATATTFTTYEPGLRVDYVFGFNVGLVKAAWVETDRLATYASDHYPVGVELTDL